MKILFLGDLHFGCRNSSKLFMDMQRRFLQNELFPYILNNDIKHVICLGDVLDKRKNIDFFCAKFVKEEFYSFFDTHKIMLYSILGNHDIYYKQSVELDGPSQLNSSPYVQFIKEPQQILKNDIDTDFYLMPWVCEENKESILSFINSIKGSNKKICCGHFELKGFPISKSFISTHGIVEIDIFSKFDKVISGHYHTPSESGNITYIGTPYELTWSDYGDKKRFIVYDTTEHSFEEILTKEKMFYKFVYTDNLIKSISYEELKDKMVKIVLNEDVTQKDLNLFLTYLEKESNPFSIQVVDNRDGITSEIDETIKINVDDPFQIMMHTIENTIQEDDIKPIAKMLVQQIYMKANGGA